MKVESELWNLGFSDLFEKHRQENGLNGFETGRIIAEHKERYRVRTETGECDAEITGNLRYSAQSREDFPAVGDWVALIPYDEDHAIIHSVYPRFSLISRKAVGKSGDKQLIGANIDTAFLVQAADRDFNLNRLERYLTISYESKVNPAIVLSKTDLAQPEVLQEILESLKKRIPEVPVFPVSNESRQGYGSLESFMEKGKTYCLLGSSGVGKSTLMNNLSGRAGMKTDSISDSTGKGRHVTSHRELILLPGGAILIDNPGMREIGIADASEGLESAFDRILELAENCKFTDCKHISETGCAVLEAVQNDEIDPASYENFLKMEREKEHFTRSVAEQRRKDKDFGKMMKNFKSDMGKLSGKYRDYYKKK